MLWPKFSSVSFLYLAAVGLHMLAFGLWPIFERQSWPSKAKKKRWFSLRGFWTSKDSFLWFREEQWKKGVVKRIHCSIVNKIRRSRCGSEHLQHVTLVLISHQQSAVFLSPPPDLQFRVKPVHFPEEGDILSVLFYDPLQPSVTLCTNLFTHLQILAAYIKQWALWRGRKKWRLNAYNTCSSEKLSSFRYTNSIVSQFILLIKPSSLCVIAFFPPQLELTGAVRESHLPLGFFSGSFSPT